MFKLPFRGRSFDDVEFVEVPGTSERRRGASARKRLALAALAFIGIALSGSAVWSLWLLPYLDERRVAAAIAEIDPLIEKPARANWERLFKYPEEHRLLVLASVFLDADRGTVGEVRKAGFHAALRIAIRHQSAEALLARGKATRDGLVGPKDPQAALLDFREAWDRGEAGVLAGDPDSLWVRARQLSEGLGVAPDIDAGHQMALRAVKGLKSWRLEEAMAEAHFGSAPFRAKEPTVARVLLDQLIEARVFSALMYVPSVCEESDGNKDKVDAGSCARSKYRRAVELGSKEAMADYGTSLLEGVGDVDDALSWIERAGDEASHDQRALLLGVRLARLAADQQSQDAIAELARVLMSSLKDSSGSRLSETERIELLYFFHDRINKKGLTRTEWSNLGYALEGVATMNNHGDVVERMLLRSADYEPLAAAIFEGFRKAAARRAAGERADVKSRPSSSAQEFDPFTAVPGQAPAKTGARVESLPSSTGYLPTERQASADGQCRFKVDNGAGGGDAVVRLYLDGKRPAVRSFFVKRGESFTAEQLAPGRYSMRYRYVGDSATYEADQDFGLTQAESAGKLRASSVTVTLYTVKDGNMKMRRVADDSF